MFDFIFKKITITVFIYKEQSFSIEEKKQIMYDYHHTPVGGHSGIFKTIKLLKQDVKNYIENCYSCQKNKSHIKTKQPLLITSTVTQLFERCCLNIMGPLPKTEMGNSTYVICFSSKFIISFCNDIMLFCCNFIVFICTLEFLISISSEFSKLLILKSMFFMQSMSHFPDKISTVQNSVLKFSSYLYIR